MFRQHNSSGNRLEMQVSSSSSAIVHGWNELLGEMTDPTLFLKKLGKSYDLCLVSNTNEAHIKHIQTSWSILRTALGKV